MVWALVIVIIVALAYFAAPLWAWFAAASVGLAVAGASVWWWIPLILLGLLFLVPQIRQELVTQPLFHLIETNGLLPKISETEKTALRAGDVWIEGELFSGKPDFAKIFSHPYPSLTPKEQAFLENEVEEVCAMTSDWEVFAQRDLPEAVWAYLKEKRFFGMIIPEEYGGLGFSAYGHSCVIEKLATHSQVLAITVMVPNSLGPAELLLHYGTPKQQQYFLPRLADGREIPCFALTEPEAGSDAASIRSEGVLFKDENGEIKIRLQFEKRYITLSAIATVIGLAFVLKDPQNLLGKGKEIGITCALVDANTPRVDQSRRHDPLGVPFVNAPLLGKDVIISIEDVIGGEAGLGEGWRMLMESLAVGRGISLPSTSTGGSKLASYVASTYAVVRYQFGLSIAKFEGIAEVLGRIGARTYMLDAAKTFTLGAINGGAKPAVANAIMKYEATEIFRANILDAMDIQGGAAIIRGPRNLLAHPYFGAPVAITVEGANIMTRTLIMFGQGLIRCHPYAYAQIEALEQRDIAAFDRLLFAHIGHVVRNGARALVLGLSRGYWHPAHSKGTSRRYEQKLAWASARFAFLGDVALGLMGASLKRRESISGRFGDILAQMYLITCTLKRFETEGSPKAHERLLEVSVNEAFIKIDESFAEITANLLDGVAGLPLRILSYLGRLNPIAKRRSDSALHGIAWELGEDEGLRAGLCSNLYNSARIKLLREAAEAMQGVKDVLHKEKTGEPLSSEEVERLEVARALQREIITVDSFTHEAYFAQARGKRKAEA